MVATWFFRAGRVVLGLVAVGLCVIFTAMFLQNWGDWTASNPDATGRYLNYSRLAALYLIPFGLCLFALWPRLWPLALVPPLWFVIATALVDPEKITRLWSIFG